MCRHICDSASEIDSQGQVLLEGIAPKILCESELRAYGPGAQRQTCLSRWMFRARLILQLCLSQTQHSFLRQHRYNFLQETTRHEVRMRCEQSLL